MAQVVIVGGGLAGKFSFIHSSDYLVTIAKIYN
jgi:hypothetical protein